jgi:hypothetical protein
VSEWCSLEGVRKGFGVLGIGFGVQVLDGRSTFPKEFSVFMIPQRILYAN